MDNLSSIRNAGADLDLFVPVELVQHYVDEGLPLDNFSTEAYRRAQQMSEGVAAKQQALRLLEQKCIALRQAAGGEPGNANTATEAATNPAAIDVDEQVRSPAPAGAAGLAAAPSGAKRKRS